MRKLFTTILTVISFGAFTANAQNITGTVQDENNKPISNVTVTLHQAKDSSIIKLDITNAEGKYGFTANNGKYLLSFSSVGFAKKYSTVFELNGNYNVATTNLSKASKGLGEVTVTSKKPLIEVKADKTIFNVESSINAVGTDAFELLRKSPGVMIDKDDNLQLAGKNGVQVYIDGRPTPMTGKDLANYLRNIQSSNIEAIELITNPSAKYDAAGNAGIINIKLKKNKSFGTNGSFNAGYAVGTYSKYNAGLNLNHRNKKLNVFGNYNYNNSKNINTLSIYRELTDTVFDQNGTMSPTSQSHNFKVGADFYANKKSTFGIIVDGNVNNTDMSNYVSTPVTYKGTFIRSLVADNFAIMHNNNINVNGNYKYSDTSGKEVNVDLNYGRFDNNNNQLQPNYYKDINNNTYSTIMYRMISPSIIDIANGKIDYEQKFAGGQLGTGIKISNVKTTNDFQRYDIDATTKVEDLDLMRSNKFTYKENVNAAYFNFNKQYKSIMLQIGLRVENSNVTGITDSKVFNGSTWKDTSSTFERKYTDLFPSASLSFNKNPMNQWSISYSRRIDRPAYQNLNPFEFKLDEYTYQKGNTNLTPQYTNTFSITNTYKYMLTTTLSYSHVKDIFAQLIDTTERSKSFITNKNVASQDIYNLSIGYPVQKGIYNAYFSVNAFYSHYKADFSEGKTGTNRNVDLEMFSANIYMQHGFNMGKGYKSELSSWLSTPSIQEGTFKSKAMGFVDIGISKQILNNQGTIKISVSDIFRTMRWRGESNFAGQTLNGQFRWESQQFKVNFNYRFGKNTVKAARNRNTGVEDESKRTKGGGGFGGN